MALERGNWGEVLRSFDRKKKKIIGIEPAAAENDGVDMFEQARVAAE